jgi:beta-glucosidase
MAYVGTSFPQVLGLVEHLGYLFDGRNPIYPFGFGLSYTQFRFENVCIEPKTIRTDGNARVSVNITNTGGRGRREGATLYSSARGIAHRPLPRLRGFKRVTLDPGQKTTVDFTISPDDLSLIGVSMNQVVEAGVFDVMVGPSSVAAPSASHQGTAAVR